MPAGSMTLQGRRSGPVADPAEASSSLQVQIEPFQPGACTACTVLTACACCSL